MSNSISLEYLNSRIGSSTTGFTADGGMYITVVNDTGATSVKGTIVATSTASNDAVRIAPANFTQAIGIVLESGIPNGSPIKVVVSGKAYVLLKNGENATRSYWCGVSDISGRMYQIPEPSSTTEHNREIGHSLETKTNGTNVLALINLHFN